MYGSYSYWTRINGILMEFESDKEAYEYKKEHPSTDQSEECSKQL